MLLNLLKKILQNKILWYMASRYMVLAIQFLASMFLAVKLGAYYFGIWSFVVLLASIGSNCNWGIGNAATIMLVQNKDNPEQKQSIPLNSLLLTAFISIIPVAVAVFDRTFGIPIFAKYHIGNWIYIIALLIAASYFASLFMNIIRVKSRIWEITAAQSLWPLSMLILLFVAKDRLLLNLLIAAYTLSFFVSIGIYLAGGHISFAGKISFSQIKTIFSKGFFLFLYNAGFAFIVLSSKLMISKYYSVNEFGYFSFGFSLANGVIMLIDSLIFIIFPKMIDMLKEKDPDKLSDALHTMRFPYLYSTHLLFYFVLAAGYFFFMFIPKYENSFESFILIMFLLLMYSNCFGYNACLLAQNKEKQIVMIVGAALVCNILLCWFFINILHVSFNHVILATIITYMLYSAAVNLYTMRTTGIKLRRSQWKNSTALKLQPLYWASFAIFLFVPYRWCLVIPFFVYSVINIKMFKKLITQIKLLSDDRLRV